MYKKPIKEESCQIAYGIMISRRRKKKKIRCGLKRLCSREDKGEYLECGIS